MLIKFVILFFFLSSFPTKSENKSFSTTLESTISSTTQCPQVDCTQPLCPEGNTFQYDPEGCNCPTIVPCPDRPCPEGTNQHWNGDNCVCPECVPYTTTAETTTTECLEMACTQPFCPRGYTLQYGPGQCSCGSVVSCGNLTCSDDTHPYWNGNCECPDCRSCPMKCPPIWSGCRQENQRQDTCGCTVCDELGYY